MEKPLKLKQLQASLPSGVHIFGAILIVALLGFTAAVFAASAANSNGLLPGSQNAPTRKVTLPEFKTGPRLPHVEQASERFASEPEPGADESFRGVASWYGPSFNGRLTANGEIYNMYAMTAATSEFHTTLPLGTKVRVVNSRNGRSVVVRITDRGPLPRGRIIDLSYGAARRLAMVKRGTAQVRVHILHWGKNRYHHRTVIADRR
jgi:rare lipoprotein A (peptidoglycan hydrolase)